MKHSFRLMIANTKSCPKPSLTYKIKPIMQTQVLYKAKLVLRICKILQNVKKLAEQL